MRMDIQSLGSRRSYGRPSLSGGAKPCAKCAKTISANKIWCGACATDVAEAAFIEELKKRFGGEQAA